MGRGNNISANQITAGANQLLYGPRQARSRQTVVPAANLNWREYCRTIGLALKKMALIQGSVDEIERDTQAIVIRLPDQSEVHIEPKRSDSLHGLSLTSYHRGHSVSPHLAKYLISFAAGSSLRQSEFGVEATKIISTMIAPELSRQAFDYIDLRNNIDAIESYRRLGYRVQVGGGFDGVISNEVEREEMINAIRSYQHSNRALSPQQNPSVGDLVHSVINHSEPTQAALDSELGRKILERPINLRVNLN